MFPVQALDGLRLMPDSLLQRHLHHEDNSTDLPYRLLITKDSVGEVLLNALQCYINSGMMVVVIGILSVLVTGESFTCILEDNTCRGSLEYERIKRMM